MGIIEDMQAAIARLEARVLQLEGALAGPSMDNGGTMAQIALEYAKRYDMDVVTLRGREQRQALSLPRARAMAAMQKAGFSTTQIGRYMDGRDHTTVCHAIKLAIR